MPAAYEKSVRTDNLTWSYHERIAARADRLYWLQQAVANKWSVSEMLEKVAADDDARKAQEDEDRRSWVGGYGRRIRCAKMPYPF